MSDRDSSDSVPIANFGELAERYRDVLCQNMTRSELNLLDALRRTDDYGVLCAAGGVKHVSSLNRKLKSITKFVQELVPELRGHGQRVTLAAITTILCTVPPARNRKRDPEG